MAKKPTRKSEIVIKIETDDGDMCIKTLHPEAHRLVVKIATEEFPELKFADLSHAHRLDLTQRGAGLIDFLENIEEFMENIADQVMNIENSVDRTQPVENGHLHMMCSPELYDAEEMKVYILESWAERKRQLDKLESDVQSIFTDDGDDS